MFLHLFNTQYQMNSHRTIKGLVDIVPFGVRFLEEVFTPCRGVVDLKNRMPVVAHRLARLLILHAHRQ